MQFCSLLLCELHKDISTDVGGEWNTEQQHERVEGTLNVYHDITTRSLFTSCNIFLWHCERFRWSQIKRRGAYVKCLLLSEAYPLRGLLRSIDFTAASSPLTVIYHRLTHETSSLSNLMLMPLPSERCEWERNSN